MEDGSTKVFDDLNKLICQECGLPLKVYSYEKINKNNNLEEIKIKLFCQNLDHKTINEFNFKDCHLLINEYLDKVCKCTLCNKIIHNSNETPYYCYSCKKIFCLNEKHEEEHKNIFKYEELKNKCLIHFDNKNENKFYCIICKQYLCVNCAIQNTEHMKEHNVKQIHELKDDLKINILNIEKELDNNKKEKEILVEKLKNLNNKIQFDEFLVKEKDNYYHLFFEYNNKINNIKNCNNDIFNNNNANVNDNNNNNNNNSSNNNNISNNNINNINNDIDKNNNININNINNINNDINKNNNISNNNINNISNDIDKNNNINSNNIINTNIIIENNNSNNEDINKNNKIIRKIYVSPPMSNLINLKTDEVLKNNGIINNENNNIDNNIDNNINNINIIYNYISNNKDNNINNNINNKNKNEIIKPNSDIESKEKSFINVIYHDENIESKRKGIIIDSQKIQREINGSLILTNDLENLDLLLKGLIKNNIKSKFFLIVNGRSAEKIINFIKKNKKYISLFIKACIYTSNLEKYKKIKEKNSDFIDIICTDISNVINFVKQTFLKLKIKSEKYNINTIINYDLYKDKYFSLHKEISSFYGDETENSFSLNYSLVNDYIKMEEYQNSIKESLLSCFQIFAELNKKNYEKIIICYLKDDNFCRILNLLLKKKDISIYKKIGYFAGNLMHSLVEYGKKENKGVNSGKVFYRGMQLKIVELLELLKNRNLKITFPYFFSMVNKKPFVDISSKRNLSSKERKEKEFYSVIMKIEYLYDEGYEPCVIDLNNLAQYPDEEEEFILLPFTFLTLKNIEIDSDKYTADIELEIIGKKEILEYKIKESKIIEYDKDEKIMIAK